MSDTHDVSMRDVMAYVLARKGVLMSDPSVGEMTDAQWLFEYYALHKRERDWLAALARLLGLDMWTKDKSIIPLSLLCGTPEMISKVQEHVEAEANAEAAMKDEAYEAFVASLANELGLGDMEPLE